MNDFKAQVAAQRQALEAAIARVLSSGWFILGPEVEAFEREFAAFVGVPHAVGVGNGMDALSLALEAVGVQPGDEVITTPNSAFASTLAILRIGARPVFVDLDDRSGALDVSRVADAVTPRTRAILPVHIYGQAVDMTALESFGITVVGDAAQAHGARLHGRDVGSYGAATGYSFYPTKNLGCLGDGGAVVCSDPAIAEQVRRARNYGQADRYQHTHLGLNSRLDELQAAILRVRLPLLPELNRRRGAIAQRYHEELSGLPLALPVSLPHGEPVWHLYPVRTPRRDPLMAFLRQRGIVTLIHYPTTIPLQPAMARFGFQSGQFPIAERWASELVSLPIGPELGDAQIDAVIAAVRAFFA
jgi:dTDP-4-amino-4,6-dideoxygalactose transaminase